MIPSEVNAPGCLVIHVDELELVERGNLRWARVFGPQEGTRALSLFYLECGPGESPCLEFESSEAVLYLLEGESTAVIGGTGFDTKMGCGLHVRPREDCRFITPDDGHAAWLAVVCPQRGDLGFSHNSRNTFDADFPERLVDGAQSELHSTSDRFYRLLVGPKTGSESVTQFIGRIPKSKAPEHYHLYEEVICILSGHGRMWAGDRSEAVRPGSMIFLPREQRHSLECLDDSGLELVGMFYPAGSPAINYS